MKIGLLGRIVIAIALGITFGLIAPDWMIRIFVTFNHVFGGFLSFSIPLIIIAFIAPGIAQLGKGAGKLLAGTTGLAYGSTIIAGLLAFFTATSLYPNILGDTKLTQFENPENVLLDSFITIDMDPPFGIMTALLLAFTIGIGMAVIKGDTLYKVTEDFRNIIEKLISSIIIPLLPIHIFGIFSNMTQGGQIADILSIFAKVFVMIILLHVVYLIIQYSVAGAISKKNPFILIKTMLPAYFTAIGTQSSAATIPVTLQQAKKTGVKSKISDFTIPLLATIHLSGSTITLVSCSIAVMYLSGMSASFSTLFPFILMLGIIMIAAPGVPGGAVMAAAGIIQSMLGFNDTLISLMIALYLAQDSFGTACNVTGDGAITIIVDQFSTKEG